MSSVCDEDVKISQRPVVESAIAMIEPAFSLTDASIWLQSIFRPFSTEKPCSLREAMFCRELVVTVVCSVIEIRSYTLTRQCEAVSVKKEAVVSHDAEAEECPSCENESNWRCSSVWRRGLTRHTD